jgi:hypothetical protein
MSQQNGSESTNMTVEGFKQEMEAFVAHIKGVVTPSAETGRALFPEFVVTQPIRDKLRSALASLEKADLSGAFWALKSSKEHFKNQQAAYSRRTLLPELLADFRDMIGAVRKGDDDDLVSLVRTAVEAYEKFVNQDPFEVKEASRLYWTACDVLNDAEEEFKTRVEKRKQEDAAAKKKQGASAAKELRGLLSEV